MSAQVYCPSCGKSVQFKKFCSFCGASLEGATLKASEVPGVAQATPSFEAVKTETTSGKMVEKIAPVDTIVNKLKIDFPNAKTIAEGKKLSFFTTLVLLKPKPEEVVCESLAIGYEIFLRIRGNYHIDYFREASYKISIDSDVKEVILLGQTFMPAEEKAKTEGGLFGMGVGRKSTKEILLKGDERLIKDLSADVLYDKDGNEISQPSILNAETNPEKENVLKAGINLENLQLNPETLVEKFKSKIFHRPGDVKKSVEETLDIPQVILIYSPFYHATYINKRSKETKQIRINGISGEVTLLQKPSKWETLCPACGKKISLEEKFCGECGTKLSQ